MFINRSLSMSSLSRLSTGSVALDRALSGGYLSGRIVEISGKESSGKSMLALHAVKQLQRQEKIAVYIDVDRKISDDYLSSIGIDKDKIHFAHPGSLDEVASITNELLTQPYVDLIVIDNVSNLISESNINSKIINYNCRSQSKDFSKFVYDLSYKSKVNDTTIIFINQYRTYFPKGGGRGRVQPMYSNLFKDFASTRISLKRASTIKSDLVNIGDRIEATIHKSPILAREGMVVFDVQYDSGIDVIKEVVDMAVELKVVEQSGAWYKFGEDVLGQGIHETRSNLIEDKNLFNTLIDNIKMKGDNDYEFIRQYTIK